MNDATCGTCRYWLELANKMGTIGECRRYPPQALWTDSGFRQAWPDVSNLDFCGEYQPMRVEDLEVTP